MIRIITVICLILMSHAGAETLKVGKVNVAALIFFHPLMKNYNPRLQGFVADDAQVPDKLVQTTDENLKKELEDKITGLRKQLTEKNKIVQDMLNEESQALWKHSQSTEKKIKEMIQSESDPAKLYNFKQKARQENEDIVKKSKERIEPHNKEVLAIRKQLADLTGKYDDNEKVLDDDRMASFMLSEQSAIVRMKNVELDVETFTEQIIQEMNLSFAVNIAFYTAVGAANLRISDAQRMRYGISEKELESDFSNPDYMKSLGMKPAEFRSDKKYKDIFKFYYFRFEFLKDILKDQVRILKKFSFPGRDDVEYIDITEQVMAAILDKYNTDADEKTVVVQFIQEMKQFLEI